MLVDTPHIKRMSLLPRPPISPVEDGMLLIATTPWYVANSWSRYPFVLAPGVGTLLSGALRDAVQSNKIPSGYLT